jgi:hypothetical protein
MLMFFTVIAVALLIYVLIELKEWHDDGNDSLN